MPSWTEKPHDVPTINVNLSTQRCAPWCLYGFRGEHTARCPAGPVPIPLSLEPFRSVVFEVRLGECDKACEQYDGDMRPDDGHWTGCRARPIRVACEIGGKTWEESHVMPDSEADGQMATYAQHEACRERWALAKALVLGKSISVSMEFMKAHGTEIITMRKQRDSVYAVLAEMARAEQTVYDAQERAAKAFDAAFMPDNFMRFEPWSRASASILERYVERLIEQVAVLS